jgi:ABC-2 type transport system ATP-binding protein
MDHSTITLLQIPFLPSIKTSTISSTRGKIMAIIQVLDVNKSFGKTKVLKNVSLTVEKGELYGLFGPNGAGKTTLLRIMTGQLKPDSGDSITDGVSISNPIEVKSKVGIVPEAETPPTFLTAYETLELTCRLRHLKDYYEKIEYWIDFFEIQDKRDVLCRDLSKGQRQKVMLATAFIHDPLVLFLDEPFINLDPIFQRRVREYLLSLLGEGRTIFMSTHILEIAERLCTRIGVLHNGEIIEQGTLDQLKNGDNENLEDVFIRVIKEGMTFNQ